MTDNDKMREEFEKWAKREGLCIAPYGASYADEKTHTAWITWQAAKSVPQIPVVGEPVAYLHADKDGKVLWSDSCVCEDAVWPHIDDDDTDQSLPVYRQPTTSITEAELQDLRMCKIAAREEARRVDELTAELERLRKCELLLKEARDDVADQLNYMLCALAGYPTNDNRIQKQREFLAAIDAAMQECQS